MIPTAARNEIIQTDPDQLARLNIECSLRASGTTSAKVGMNERLLRTLALGVAAAAATVILAPSIAQAACPAARRGMKTAFVAYMRGREAMAGFMEMVEDAYAEATAELKQEADAMAAAGGDAPSRENDNSNGESGVAKKRKRRS